MMGDVRRWLVPRSNNILYYNNNAAAAAAAAALPSLLLPPPSPPPPPLSVRGGGGGGVELLNFTARANRPRNIISHTRCTRASDFYYRRRIAFFRGMIGMWVDGW